MKCCSGVRCHNLFNRTFSHIRKHFVFIRVVVNGHITVKSYLATICCGNDLFFETRSPSSYQIQQRHLTGHKTIPNKGIDLELILSKYLAMLSAFGKHLKDGSLVGILRR